MRRTPQRCCCETVEKDAGGSPFLCNLVMETEKNRLFRSALWTGTHLQTTLMLIPRGGEVGEEVHTDTDQMLFITSGHGALFLEDKERGCYREYFVECGTAIFIPQGTKHNVKNIGKTPLRLFSVYAPPHHPFGTRQETKQDADLQEENRQN